VALALVGRRIRLVGGSGEAGRVGQVLQHHRKLFFGTDQHSVRFGAVPEKLALLAADGSAVSPFELQHAWAICWQADDDCENAMRTVA
jgi:hypothetical protein